MMRLARIAPLFLTMTLWSGIPWTGDQADAAHLFVDPVLGDDHQGEGTVESPWKTLTFAMGRAQAGDYIRLAQGTYSAASGESSTIELRSGVSVHGSGQWVTRVESTFVVDTPEQDPLVQYVQFTGLDARARGREAGFVLRHCVLDLGPTSAYLTAEQGGTLVPQISETRLQCVSPRIFVGEAREGSVLGGYIRNCFYYLGMDGAHLHHIYLTGGSFLSTSFISNIFEAKKHLGLSFYIGYRFIQPRNVFNSLFLNNTFLADGFHLMDGVTHDLMLVNNIFANRNDWSQIGEDQVWHNIVSDGDYGGMNGNILADPMFVDQRNDFRLRPDSPGVDAGVDHEKLLETDFSGVPRILDGNLDLRACVDIGAHELTHCEVVFAGDQRVGGTLSIAIDGPSNLNGLLYLGLEEGAMPLGPWGTLFLRPFDRQRPHYLGALPRLLNIAIPDSPELAGVRVLAQGVAFDPESGGGGTSSARAEVYIKR